MDEPYLFGDLNEDDWYGRLESSHGAWLAAAFPVARDFIKEGEWGFWKRRGLVSTDELWEKVEETVGRPNEKRAWGVLMPRLAKRGVLEISPWTKLSTQPDNHSRPVRLWYVMILKKATADVRARWMLHHQGIVLP